ncbi:MAG: hypothetical protein L3J09_02215 [Flavobacteriaceae bacterium]|nr:hypothetical protein [Flavobacteriaceae bacterium]
MNFNYSYKAFVITLLLVGNLYLILYFTQLPSSTDVIEDEYEIEYIQEALLEEKLASLSSEKIKIETHIVNNKAENFIKELENERQENPETLEEKLSEINNAISDSENNHDAYETTNKEKLKKIDNKPSFSEEVTKHSNNKNTTNSYRLINRKATYFPNPVYTCDAYGKVVLHIEVNAFGKVILATINANSSTTNNACLLESAIDYAKKARFTKSENKPSQMGSITYVFPGQN